MEDYRFPPDGRRAGALNAQMHRELADSLEHIAEASCGQVDIDLPRLNAVVAQLKAGSSFPPSLFADYYELVNAIDEDDEARAGKLFASVALAKPTSQNLAIISLDDPGLGPEKLRYQRLMNADPSVDLGFTPPSPDVFEAFVPRLQEGLALADRALPDLTAEIRAIIRQIVIVGSDPTKAYQFDGGSHYQLWGALFLNGQYHPDPLAVVEVLAHESAHSLLFGFCTQEALVENPDDELYASPLRVDARPMDGIYHATFVSARMHWAMSTLTESGQLAPALQARAREAAQTDLRNFQAGFEVVREHGRLTRLGEGLLAQANAYMDTVR